MSCSILYERSSSATYFIASIFFKKNYLFLPAPGLHCCQGFSIVGASRGYSLVAVLRLLIVVASLVAEHGL